MTGCPVLRELAVTEDYDREHEQAPVLSGGDYDISAIRDCGESCLIGALARQRKLQIEGLEEAVEGLTLENRRLREALEEVCDNSINLSAETLKVFEKYRDGEALYSFSAGQWRRSHAAYAAARSLLAELEG